MMDSIEELKEEGNVKKLLELLKEGEQKEREDAAKALGILGSKDALSDLIDCLKNDPASTVRANAALALSNFEAEDCKNALKGACEDEDWEVRHDTAIAMADFEDNFFEDELCELIEDKVTEVRKKALDSLGKIAGPDKIPMIEKFLEDEDLKKHALRAISNIDTEKSIGPLKRTYYDGDQEMREIALEGLGRIGTEEAIEVISDALKDDSWRIREEATKTLGMEREKDHIEPLIQRLDDEKNYVVEAALRGLGRIGKDDLLTSIEGHLNDDDPGIRIAASEALGEFDSKKSGKLLLESMKKENNPRVLWSKSDAISRLSEDVLEEIENEIEYISESKKVFINVGMIKGGFTSYVEETLDHLESDRWKIRQKVAESLEKVNPSDMNKRTRKKLLNALQRRLKDNDKWVKARSIRTLAKIIDRSEKDDKTEDIKDEILEMERTEVDEDVLEAVKDAKYVLTR